MVLPAALRRRSDLSCFARPSKAAPDDGIFSIEIENQSGSVQSYVPNTAVLKTTLRGDTGSVEITDFCPRFYHRHRTFRPQMLIRQIVPIEGNPRVKIRLRPRFDYGAKAPTVTYGSNHIRYVGDKLTLRLTTDAPIDYLLEETAFKVTEPIHLILGPDETLTGELGGSRRDLPQEHHQLLAHLDAPAGGAGRMAGGGDPRRHHAQDVRLRADRRDRRRDDDQHPGSAEQRAQLGLPLLLGT